MSVIENAEANQGTESERNVVLIAYILHACAVFTLITAIAGVIINHIKVNDTDSEFVRSHHRWMLRTFWWGVFWFIVCTVLVIVAIGLLGYLIVAVWWIYRLVRGFLAYVERRPLPV